MKEMEYLELFDFVVEKYNLNYFGDINSVLDIDSLFDKKNINLVVNNFVEGKNYYSHIKD
jgi:hypothetical protein